MKIKKTTTPNENDKPIQDKPTHKKEEGDNWKKSKPSIIKRLLRLYALVTKETDGLSYAEMLFKVRDDTTKRAGPECQPNQENGQRIPNRQTKEPYEHGYKSPAYLG